VKNPESAVNKTASVIKKLQLRSEHIRVLAFTDLRLAQGGTSVQTACGPPADDYPTSCTT
jgi:hypothetical protein